MPFPRLRVCCHRRGKEEQPDAATIPCEPSESAGTILVADDDPENREILHRLLLPCGFEVEFAENGRIAIEKMESTDFDAVLLDNEMPEMTDSKCSNLFACRGGSATLQSLS